MSDKEVVQPSTSPQTRGGDSSTHSSCKRQDRACSPDLVKCHKHHSLHTWRESDSEEAAEEKDMIHTPHYHGQIASH